MSEIKKSWVYYEHEGLIYRSESETHAPGEKLWDGAWKPVVGEGGFKARMWGSRLTEAEAREHAEREWPEEAASTPQEARKAA